MEKKWLMAGIAVVCVVAGAAVLLVSVMNTAAPAVPASAQPASPTDPVSGSTQDPGSLCNLSTSGSRILVPTDTSVPIGDPMPGIRYSFTRDESGKTIVLAKGEIVEINLGFAPGLAMRWVVRSPGAGSNWSMTASGIRAGISGITPAFTGPGTGQSVPVHPSLMGNWSSDPKKPGISGSILR